MPQITPAKPAQNTSSSLEISQLQKNLATHQSGASAKISQTLEAQLKQILPKLVTGVDQNSLSRISKEVAAESARDALENIGKINNFSQANTVIADSITQSIVAHPALEGKLKLSEEKIFARIFEKTSDVVRSHQQDLSKAAVLGGIVNIAKLQKPDEQLRSLVTGAVDAAVASQMPLAKPEVNQTLYGNASGFLQTYLGNLNARIQPQLSQGKIPDFASYQAAKSAAFSQSKAGFERSFSKYKGRIDPTDITNRIGFILGLDPSLGQFTSVSQAKGINAFTLRLMLSSDRGQVEFDSALLSHDRSWVEKQYARLREQVERFKKQRSLTYKDRKAYLAAQKNFSSLGKVLSFRTKNEQRAKNWMALVQTIPQPTTGHNLTLAYQAAITSREASMGSLPGVYSPRSLAGNPIFLARNTLSLLSPKLGLGDLFGSLKESFMAPSTLGMGRTLAARASLGLGIASAAGNLMKRIIKGGAALLGGMFLFFGLMGKAALTGAIIGAGIGGIVGTGIGAYLGFQIGIALAPFTFGLSIPAFTLLGAAGGGLIGAFVFGAAGGLIALGLASGSATTVSMGAGAVIGGVVGTYAGAVVGASVGTAIGTGLAVITGGLATPLIPVFTAMGAFTGAAIGAVVGTFMGAAIGYIVGKYILAPIQGFVSNIFSASGQIGALGSSALSGFGSLVTGLASTVWGGITAGTAGAFGALSSAAGFLVGGLGSISLPFAAVAVPVFGGIGAIAIGSLIVGITTATSFFSTDKELNVPGTGDNAYFTVTKTTDPDELENVDVTTAPGATITFHITLKAKVNLTEVEVTDTLRVDGKNSDGISNFTIDNDNSTPPRPISPPCGGVPGAKLDKDQTWECEFGVLALNEPGLKDFTDSVMSNTVTVSATSGTDSITDSAYAYVLIGSPEVCGFLELQDSADKSWSDDEKTNINSVCLTIRQSQQFTSFLEEAAAGGKITLRRVKNGSLPGGKTCGVASGKTIEIGCDMEPVSFAKYVIIHELAHVLGNYKFTETYKKYTDQGIYDEGLIPTYQYSGGGPSESFAEMIADYVVYKEYSFKPQIWSNFPGGQWVNLPSPWLSYPTGGWKNHYQFAKTNIFGGYEY